MIKVNKKITQKCLILDKVYTYRGFFLEEDEIYYIINDKISGITKIKKEFVFMISGDVQ